MTSLRKYWRLLATLVILQSLTCALPYVRWFNIASVISASWMTGIAAHYSNVLVLFWFWMVAIPLIGTGAWWSSEINEGLYLEVWRHRTYRRWLARELAFAVFLNTFVLGAGMSPFLLAAFPGQAHEVVGTLALMAAYSTGLSLIVITTTVLGAKTNLAVVGALLLHAINITFDGMGLPNAVQFFLSAERGDAFSLLITVLLLALTIAVLLARTTPAALIARGSESR